MIFITNTIDIIGDFGTFILLLTTIFLLWNKNNLFVYYSYGYFLNTILNLFLKAIIKQPRPSEDPAFVDVALKHQQRFKVLYFIPQDKFGMPSGRAQNAWYSTIFIYLALKNTYITTMYLLITLLTMYHRVQIKAHSVSQVIAGGIVGIIFAYCIYAMAQKQIIGKLIPKKDDNSLV
jgi:membrane-associated phospholipid phosphatase